MDTTVPAVLPLQQGKRVRLRMGQEKKKHARIAQPCSRGFLLPYIHIMTYIQLQDDENQCRG